MVSLGSSTRLSLNARSGLRGVSAMAAATSILISLGAACGSGGYSASSTKQPTSAATPATSGATSEQSAPGTAINVVQKDFAITVNKAQASEGQITFDVKNEGPSTHEFVVFETDAAADALPLDASKVDEEAKEVTHIDEIADIGAGESKQLTVKLASGEYVLICNLPGHYGLGMRTGFEVS